MWKYSSDIGQATVVIQLSHWSSHQYFTPIPQDGFGVNVYTTQLFSARYHSVSSQCIIQQNVWMAIAINALMRPRWGEERKVEIKFRAATGNQQWAGQCLSMLSGGRGTQVVSVPHILVPVLLNFNAAFRQQKCWAAAQISLNSVQLTPFYAEKESSFKTHVWSRQSEYTANCCYLQNGPVSINNFQHEMKVKSYQGSYGYPPDIPKVSPRWLPDILQKVSG